MNRQSICLSEKLEIEYIPRKTIWLLFKELFFCLNVVIIFLWYFTSLYPSLLCIHIMVTTRSGLVLSDDTPSMSPTSMFTNEIYFDLNIIRNIMEFLPLPDLNRLCCTSKLIRSHGTVDMIVKAALLNGGTAKISIDKLYPLIEKRCIHPIDAEGLWELLQTNNCSVCKTLLKRNESNAVKHIRSGIGLNICWKCLQ